MALLMMSMMWFIHLKCSCLYIINYYNSDVVQVIDINVNSMFVNEYLFFVFTDIFDRFKTMKHSRLIRAVA